jgi:Zn-dependent protease
VAELLQWSFRAFRIFGIPVRIHWTLLLVVVGYPLQGLVVGGTFGLAWLGAVMGVLFASVLIHELGHCWAARAVGGHAEQIVLWPLGGAAYVGHGGAPSTDIKVAAAGPLMHVPLAALCFGGLALLVGGWDWNWLNVFGSWAPFGGIDSFEGFGPNLLLAAARLQIILLAFNLLVPGFPLDGGRILIDFLVIRHGRQKAAIVASYISMPVGIVLTLFAFMRGDIFMAFIGVQVIYEAWLMRKLARMGELEAHPTFAMLPEYEYMPERARRAGWWARFKQRRALRRLQEQARREAELQARVDTILEKVGREGIGSLTSEERRVLEEASRSARGK